MEEVVSSSSLIQEQESFDSTIIQENQKNSESTETLFPDEQVEQKTEEESKLEEVEVTNLKSIEQLIEEKEIEKSDSFPPIEEPPKTSFMEEADPPVIDGTTNSNDIANASSEESPPNINKPEEDRIDNSLVTTDEPTSPNKAKRLRKEKKKKKKEAIIKNLSTMIFGDDSSEDEDEEGEIELEEDKPKKKKREKGKIREQEKKTQRGRLILAFQTTKNVRQWW